MPRQSEYRFSIDFPNGPACDVVRFQLTETLSQPFRLELDLASTQDNIDLTALLDGTAVFTIARDGEPVRTVTGIVTAFDQGDTGFRRTRYRAVVEPPLVRLGLRHNSRIFQRKGVPDILSTLLKEQRVLAHVDLPRAKHHHEREYCVQHRELDLQFFQRLAGEEGLVYYFDPNDQSRLVLSDALFITAPSLPPVDKAPGTVAYQPNPGGDAGPCLWRFTHRRKLAITHATQRDYLFKNPPVRLETRSSAEDAVGHYEHYSYPGRYKDSNVGERFTQTLTNALRHDARLAELEGDDARLWPGLGFVLNEHPNSSMQKDWRVASLHHEGEQSSSLEEESSGAENGSRYRYTGTAIPARADWKPEPCPRPVIAGPQIAHVVGPPNEEIHTDEHGRVMVWFPWDREGRRENSSCWIRVSQGWAGPTYGMMAIPRIGHEVIVSFMDGDPDQPVITGRTYHGNNLPPYRLPQHKTRSTWKSQTHKGKGSNEIRFEDEDGMQEVYIHAQRDQNNVVEHDETTKVGNDRTETVGQNETINIGHDRSEQVGRNEELSVGQDRRETVSQDHTLDVVRTRRLNVGQDLIEEVGNQRLEKTASNRIVDTGGHYTHTVQGRHEVEAGERMVRRTQVYELDAADRTIIRGPGGTLTIDASGITLEGVLIKIKGQTQITEGRSPSIEAMQNRASTGSPVCIPCLLRKAKGALT